MEEFGQVCGDNNFEKTAETIREKGRYASLSSI